MRVAIVYDKERAKGNERFALLLGRGLKKYGIETRTFVYPETNFTECDAVVMRTLIPELSEEFTAKGVPVFNNIKTQLIAGDKAKTYEFLREIGVPFIPYKRMPCTFGEYPVIVKSVDGHGGTEVFIAGNDAEFSELKKKIEEEFSDENNLLDRFIVQRLADKSDDKRVYVLGGEPVVAMKRVNRFDYKSNYKQGGIASVAPLSEEERGYVRRIYEGLGCDYVGIDFMTYKGKPVVNEIEDIVGCRMVYENTDVDILNLYAKYIAVKLGKC